MALLRPGSLVRLSDEVIEPIHGWQGLVSRNAVGVVVSSAFDQATKSTSVVVAFNDPSRFVADVSELIPQEEDDMEADLVGRILNAHNSYEGLAYARYAPHKKFQVPKNLDVKSKSHASGYQFSEVIATPETVHLEPSTVTYTYTSTRTVEESPVTYETPEPTTPETNTWLCMGQADDGRAPLDADDDLEVTRT